MRPRFVVHQHLVQKRLPHVDDRWQRLVVDHHRIERVLGDVVGVGDGDGDGLAHVAHLFARQGHLQKALEAGQLVHPHGYRFGRIA